MKYLSTLALLAGFVLAGAPAHAEIHSESTFAITYILDVSHSDSLRPGAAFVIRALAHMRMHEDWTGTTYTCHFDPYTLHVTANGRSVAKPKPAPPCDNQQHTSSVFGSINFNSFPTTPHSRWADAQTMSASESLQWPVDPTVASYLSPVSWQTQYKSDGRTFVTSHGTGVMIEDRAVGILHLHAHLTGSSGMEMRIHPFVGHTLPMTMNMYQQASLFLQISNPSNGRSISENDVSKFTATMHPL